MKSLQWRHDGRDGVSNHQAHDYLLNRLFGHISKKTLKLRVTGLCEGLIIRWQVNSLHKGPVTRKMFPFDDVIVFFAEFQTGKANICCYNVRAESPRIDLTHMFIATIFSKDTKKKNIFQMIVYLIAADIIKLLTMCCIWGYMWYILQWTDGGRSERVALILGWRHQMETFSALLALCVGNSPVIGEFPEQKLYAWITDE